MISPKDIELCKIVPRKLDFDLDDEEEAGRDKAKWDVPLHPLVAPSAESPAAEEPEGKRIVTSKWDLISGYIRFDSKSPAGRLQENRPFPPIPAAERLKTGQKIRVYGFPGKKSVQWGFILLGGSLVASKITRLLKLMYFLLLHAYPSSKLYAG
jgi:hypothetical protein